MKGMDFMSNKLKEKDYLIVEPFGTFDIRKAKGNPFVKKVEKSELKDVNLKLESDVLDYFTKRAKEHEITLDQLVNNYLKRALV